MTVILMFFLCIPSKARVNASNIFQPACKHVHMSVYLICNYVSLVFMMLGG